jgi:hypothetical protein
VEDFRVPDRIGTVEGWRAWWLVADRRDPEPGPRLRSIVWSDEWEPMEPMCATCRVIPRTAYYTHEAPSEECHCGIYATFEREEARTSWAAKTRYGLPPYLIPLYRVLGRVAMWGTVVEHETGARASTAYPLEFELPRRFPGALLSPSEAAAALEPWGVPVGFLDESWELGMSAR